ncbi:MAG TPA: PilN domain-containing protein [Verrucomicrobiae bacterium]|jgi:Tfp pilus assembly protein PilN|nr:PilN domain-containing protein [Verrucomicrobiae bacterium]
MIKINLLETNKGKGKRGSGGGPAMPTMQMGDMGSPKLKVLVILVLAGLINVGYWYRLDRQEKAIAAQMKVAEAKNRELADVKARFLERQNQANAYKRRVDVIDGLRANQTGPVNLLAMMGETVNNTEAVWLTKLDDTGPSVNVEGTALSTDAVANLIANLQKTGFFKNVEIKETWQDEQIKDMQAFQFILTCDKAAGGASSTKS